MHPFKKKEPKACLAIGQIVGPPPSIIHCTAVEVKALGPFALQDKQRKVVPSSGAVHWQMKKTLSDRIVEDSVCSFFENTKESNLQPVK